MEVSSLFVDCEFVAEMEMLEELIGFTVAETVSEASDELPVSMILVHDDVVPVTSSPV